jgi:hypothetical protein
MAYLYFGLTCGADYPIETILKVGHTTQRVSTRLCALQKPMGNPLGEYIRFHTVLSYQLPTRQHAFELERIFQGWYRKYGSYERLGLEWFLINQTGHERYVRLSQANLDGVIALASDIWRDERPELMSMFAPPTDN